MKRILAWALMLALVCGLLAGCSEDPANSNWNDPNSATAAPLGDDDDTFGDSLEDMNAYEGYFEEDTVDVTVTCVSGTPGCYTLEGGTLTFTAVQEDSVYAVSGRLKGNIVIDTGDGCKFDLELQGLSLVCDTVCPIVVLSGDEVSLTAKKDTQNYIYDTRAAVDSEDETQYSAAVYSLVDLEICGKGSLMLVSENNNGIHTKDDLQVKNLTLTVACTDNALKGNDSVTLESGTTTLISTQGDGIKTTNSDISGKGNQRGTITVSGGNHTVYAACDGLDAAYDVVIEGSETVLNVYTDKYSNYSSEVTAVDGDNYYIRFTSKTYSYSVKYYNSDSDYCWVNAEYHSSASSSRSTYYYFSFPKMSEYEKMKYYIYTSDMEQGQEEDYLACTDYLTPNNSYDTFALTAQGNSLSYSFTNYTTTVQEDSFGPGGMGGHGGGMGGMGGMGEGNSDKGDYSTKGLKSANEIRISDGTVNIKAYDDAIHANCDSTLENGDNPTGNVTVSGGNVTVYSNDDGLHADGVLTVSGGSVSVINSYEGLEGVSVNITGGYISVIASDDGVNSTATSGTGITVSDGNVYIYCSGDGLDANSRTSGTGIVFTGGNTVVISTSSGNSAIDTENGYTYSGGRVVAVMPAQGMSSEATNSSGYKSNGTSSNVSLKSGAYLTVEVSGSTVVTVQMPTSLSAKVIYLGSKSASISSETSTSATLDDNGVRWE